MIRTSSPSALLSLKSPNPLLLTASIPGSVRVASKGAEHRGLVRLPDVPARQRTALMGDILERHATQLQAGALITVRGGRIRVTPQA